MENPTLTPDEYVQQLPAERQEGVEKLRKVLRENLPDGFEEMMSHGMIGYVVPHSLYPAGYHVNPGLPLPFISIASQKSNIALHHMGMYADEKLLNWFTTEYPKHAKNKLDMGKSCIRFKKPGHIPYDLIAELARKITPEEWIGTYESVLK